MTERHPQAGCPAWPAFKTRRVRPAGYHAGFTLLELLVVIIIISILFTYTTLAIRTDSPEDMIKQEAMRMGRLIELALEESILRGEEYAIEFDTDGYQFLRFQQNRWQPLTGDKLLRERKLPHEMELELQLEETEVTIELGEKKEEEDDTDEEDAASRKPQPQVYLLSSGEVTPEFDVRLYILGVEDSYIVRAGFDGTVKTEKSEL